MSGFFGVVSDKPCITDLFYGTDYHSHLGTRRAGMATTVAVVDHRVKMDAVSAVAVVLNVGDGRIVVKVPRVVFLCHDAKLVRGVTGKDDGVIHWGGGLRRGGIDDGCRGL